MDIKTLHQLTGWFLRYVESFKHGDEDVYRNIVFKEGHTERVRYLMVEIGRELGLNGESLLVAEVIGLFHDIGRFYQYSEYRTFVNGNSIHHAEFGVKVLQEHGVLDELEETKKNVILRSIVNHSLRVLPLDETEDVLFFSKLIRDADKLDICRISLENYEGISGEYNGPIGFGLPDLSCFLVDIYCDIMDGKSVSYTRMMTLNDFKMIQMAWVRDVNFACTLRRLCKLRYLERIHGSLLVCEESDTLLMSLQNYVAERIEMGEDWASHLKLGH